MLNSILSSMSLSMIADIACLAIVAIFAVVSLFKGFVRQIFGFLATLIAMIVAYIFSDELLNFLDSSWQITEKFANTLLSAIGSSPALSLEVTTENIVAAVQAFELPQFVTDFAIKLLPEVIDPNIANVGVYISNILAHYILLSACYAVIFVVARLILIIVKKILELLVKLPVLHGVDKLLGLLLGLIKGVLFLYVVVFIVGILPGSIPTLTTMKIALNSSMIGAFIQNNNLFATIITWLMSVFN